MAEIDDVRFYEMIRDRIEHEDGLIVQRLSWLVGSQSFLFTAFAIVLNGIANASGLGPSVRLKALYSLLPLVGILSNALIYAGILAALRAMTWLRASFEARGKSEAALGAPPLMTPSFIRTPGLAAPILLPLLFIAAWSWLLIQA